MEALWQFDLQLFQFINQTIANPLFDFSCPVLRGKSFLIICYILFGIWVYKSYPSQIYNIILAGVLTFTLTDQISASVVKPLFHRLRPCNDSRIVARLIIEHCGSGFSFVSAHATNSFGMAAFLSVIFIKQKRTIAVLTLWAMLVSFSQVYVGIHYPADVVAGGLLGVIIGATTGLLFHKISLSPQTNT